MNSVWIPKSFNDVDCDSNQSKVVLLIHFSNYDDDKLEQSLLPFIRKNNCKILIFKQSFPLQYYDHHSHQLSIVKNLERFLLIKKQLDANQKVKIIFFGHLYRITSCYALTILLNGLELFQLPYGPDNLGLVLLENGEHEYWDKGLDKLDLTLLPSHLEGIYVLHGMAWDHCVDLSYRIWKCEQYGCPALKVLTKKDLNNQFTNILLVKMTVDGQLLDGKEKLEAFINDRLQFTNLTKTDVQLFQSDTFKKLNNIYEHSQKLLLQKYVEGREVYSSKMLAVNSTSGRLHFYSSIEIEGLYGYALESHIAKTTKRRSKRQNSQELVGADKLFEKMLNLVNRIFMRSDLFSVRIRDAMLKILDRMDSEYEKKRKQTICDRKTVMPGYRDDILLRNFQDLHQILFNVDYIKTVKMNMEIESEKKEGAHWMKLVRVDLEKIFQSLISEFTNNWYNKTERIESAVGQLVEHLTRWADKVPINGDDKITWDNFSDWVGEDAILLSKINVAATSDFLTDWEINSKVFRWMIRDLLYACNINVTSVAIQQLATSKLEHVDAVVAVLDRTFMIGIRNLHQKIDQEEWMTMRPPIFNYLHRLQQKNLLFDHFLVSMKALFDIHDIELPIAPYEKLQVVKSEFDVYQKRMEGYINGTNINTTQQWGRKLHQTTEYMFENSGVQHKSFINGAAKWIKDELMFKQTPIWSGFDFDGTLVLLNLIIRKWFKGRRNF
jgi:hypothetical protein